MSLHFAQPWWLLAFAVGCLWVLGLGVRSDAQLSRWRRWTVIGVRLLILGCLCGALAGAQWMTSQDGMNVFYLLDRSDSIPVGQQESAREWVQKSLESKGARDRAGVVLFGSQASIERTVSPVLSVEKLFGVVDSQRTDLASAVRLATAAFPESGQRRLVILSDGNENVGEAVSAVESARALGVSVDVVPLGVGRGGDVSVQKFVMPSQLKKGQTFEVKVFVETDHASPGTLRLYRDDALLGEQKVDLTPGKNLFTFSQTLEEPAFYRYDVQLEAAGDPFPQNNRATSFANVRGDPRVLLVTASESEDATLVAALRASRLDVRVVQPREFPTDLAEVQSYDSIFLSNVSAGDLGETLMKFIESAVRDFGLGLVCVGGDQSYAAGAYRGTPLEDALPVDMELSSKKVLPSGALAMVMHGMEFMNGNQVARQTALGVLDALGPGDELGVVLWDGQDRWLFPMTKVGDRKSLGKLIVGMNQGDLPSFENVMKMAHEGLRKSTAGLRHMIIFSDGDPGPPSQKLMESIVADRITVSAVLIAGHAGPETMREIADRGKGRFYNVQSASQLPQIFIKEAAVVMKSAIFEEPFQPKLAAGSELVRGIGGGEFPTLRGYVATNPKSRAEVPIVSDKGDPVLAHWQYGLGRAVAFTSDAKARWASDWLQWAKYRQFWSQVAQWSLRRLDNAELDTRISVEKGEGVVSVEAVDREGNYRNFLNLQAVVVSPSGERTTHRLGQNGPGRYEVRFPTTLVGGYLVNLMEIENGKMRGSQILGASVNYSPEFGNTQPNRSYLKRLAEIGRGQELSGRDPQRGPFQHDREKTVQPHELWETLLRIAILLFPLDVGLRRVQLDAEEWRRLTMHLRRLMGIRSARRTEEGEESLASLLARRDEVRSRQPVAGEGKIAAPSDLFSPRQQPESLGAAGEKAGEAGRGVVDGGGGEAAGGENKLAGEASMATRLLDAKRKARRS